MKKIFTLMLASLFSVALFAASTADRRPSVTIKNNSNYEIVIDGRTFYSNNMDNRAVLNLRDGRHSIEVYKVVNTGLFRKSRKMVSASAFTVRNSDIRITVDYFGKLQIVERNNRNDRDWGRYDEMERYDRHDRNDRNDRGGRF